MLWAVPCILERFGGERHYAGEQACAPPLLWRQVARQSGVDGTLRSVHMVYRGGLEAIGLVARHSAATLVPTSTRACRRGH